MPDGRPPTVVHRLHLGANPESSNHAHNRLWRLGRRRAYGRHPNIIPTDKNRTMAPQVIDSGLTKPDQSGPVDPSLLHRILPWLVGLAGAVVVLGPTLAGGSILNLDFVALPELHLPRGAWGLGPELPRRVPMFVLLAWTAPLLGGTLGMKLLLVTSLAAATAGATRLALPVPLPWRLGAGLVYAFSPFTLTRIGVGHLFIVATMALLPWALPWLLEPGRSRPRTLLWGFAFGLIGWYGGLTAGIVVVVGMIATRPARPVRLIAGFVGTQLPWLVPGVLVLMAGGQARAGAAPFATHVERVDDPLRILAGHGFWQPAHQVGWTDGPWVAVFGAVLLGLAWYGRRELPTSWSRSASTIAMLALALVFASGLPGLRTLYADLASLPLGGVFREGQRLFPLYLVWAAPAAVHGAHRVSRSRSGSLGSAVLALPLAIALVLASGAVWGIGGRLDPVDIPAEWGEIHDIVAEDPGTVLALPWAQYLDMRIADNRRVLNPLPLYLGGDVVVSSNPQLGDGNRERSDPREGRALELILQGLDGEPIAEDLAAMGVRWVVLLHDIQYLTYREVLIEDPGLDQVVGGDSISLWSVEPWAGEVVTDQGEAVSIDPVVTPLARLDAGPAATWSQPASSGWLRGWHVVGRTDDGLLALPAGSGPLWYWPAVITLAGDIAALVIAVAAVLTLRARRAGRRRASVPHPGDTGSGDAS
jgi:hypothetical protein